MYHLTIPFRGLFGAGSGHLDLARYAHLLESSEDGGGLKSIYLSIRTKDELVTLWYMVYSIQPLSHVHEVRHNLVSDDRRR